MRVLVATAMYPTAENPVSGTFIKTQVDTLSEMGLHMEPFVIGGNNRKLAYVKAIPRLHSRLRVGDIDLIHANYVYAGLVARAQRLVPVVITFNGSDLLGPVDNANGSHSTLGDFSVLASKALARTVDAAIVPTEQMANRIRGLTDVRVLPHGIDMDLFAPTPRDQARTELGLDNNRPYILFAARSGNHVKNFPLARAATEALRDTYSGVELLVVHDASQADLAKYMSACDALVFPSFQEGSPNVVKQAMACNLPIVASHVGDISQMIGPTSGCHVCELNVNAFKTALAQVLSTRQRTAGRLAVGHLDRRRVAAEVSNLYETVVQRRATKVRRRAGV